jgi:hypothetical protein
LANVTAERSAEGESVPQRVESWHQPFERTVKNRHCGRFSQRLRHLDDRRQSPFSQTE